MGLDPRIIRNITHKRRYAQPMPIQKCVMPILLQHKQREFTSLLGPSR